MDRRDWRGFAGVCGFVAPVSVLGAIFLATVLASPETFTWRGRALSHMGHYETRTFWLFNGGLIVGGVIGLPFTWRLWIDGQDVFERLGIVVLVVSLVGMIGVGIFFLGHPAYYLSVGLHNHAAVTYFVAAPFAQWIYGTGSIRTGRITLGLASIWLGIVHSLAWVSWLLYRSVAPDPMAWFAVPEFLAALSFGIWIVVLATDVRRRERRSTARGQS
ncbi:DUF998 domain-containing protein [Natrarchaeobius sp. A-rgal3]|uniref:DUF998 domain-containing protein n=1 Tax=Natrarchaeobius versutus TaxID=1679078 RepID=UPI00350F5269